MTMRAITRAPFLAASGSLRLGSPGILDLHEVLIRACWPRTSMVHGMCATDYIFSPFLPLVLMLRDTCQTVIVPFHAISVNLSCALLFYPYYDHLAQGQGVSAQCDFMCVVTKKGGSFDTILGHIHLADVLSVSILRLKNHYSFVGSCLVSTEFSSSTVHTERTN